jgi:long-chain acyl-CoA synthetase
MNLPICLLRTADRQPEKIAIYFGEDTVRYGELAAHARALAAHLRQTLAVRPGDRVGLWLRNRPEFVSALAGILHADAIAVPINSFLKAEEVTYVLSDADIDVLLTDESVASQLEGCLAARPGLRTVPVETLAQLTATSRGAEAIPERTETDVAVLVYTSGTTGRPKGAMLTHGNLLHNVESCRRILEIVEFDRFVLMLPMFHSFMLTVCILLPLITGGSIVLIRSLSPAKAMISEILRNGGSILPAMAQVFRALAGLPPGIQLPLRLCISGAGPLPAAILQAFNARFPEVPLIEGYGLSEASPVVAVNPVRGPWIPGTIGIPIPDVEVSIQDDDGGLLGDLQDGEICVRGGNVMRGYWNAADKTAEAFRNGWLLTGDIGHRRTDGYLVITDRKKDMLKPNGMNVYPREIEEVIYRFPGIREAAVVGEPDERRGERPVAFVAVEDGVTFDEDSLLGFLREHLADFKLPRRAHLLPALPRNSTGKVLKTHLREILKAGGTDRA